MISSESQSMNSSIFWQWQTKSSGPDLETPQERRGLKRMIRWDAKKLLEMKDNTLCDIKISKFLTWLRLLATF